MIKPKTTYKTEAIVIKTFDLFEADRIITLISPDHGLISAVAKGIRRTKSKFGARLEPFSWVTLVLYKGRDLDTIIHADAIKTFDTLRMDLDTVIYGSAMLELAAKIAPAGQAHPEAFVLLKSALETLEQKKVIARLLLAAFQLKLAVVAGFEPMLKNCAGCQTSFTHEAMISFSNNLGGGLCRRCSVNDPESIKISTASAELLPRLLGIKRQDLELIDPDGRRTDELLNLTLGYLRFHLDVRLRSLDYLKEYDMFEEQARNDEGVRDHG